MLLKCKVSLLVWPLSHHRPAITVYGRDLVYNKLFSDSGGCLWVSICLSSCFVFHSGWCLSIWVVNNSVVIWTAVKCQDLQYRGHHHGLSSVCVCVYVSVSQSLSQWLAVWMWEVMFINAGADHSHPDRHSLTPFGLMSNWLTWTILNMNHQRLTKEEEGAGWAERDRENHNCCLIFDGWVNGFPCMLLNALEQLKTEYNQWQWTPRATEWILAHHLK